MRPFVRSALLDAWALVMPVECAGCGANDRSLCDGCRAFVVPTLATQIIASGVPTATALRYETTVRRIVLAFKEDGRVDLARALAPAMRAVVRAAPVDAEVMAVPSTRSSFRRRGYDPVETLLTAAGYRPVRVLRLAAGLGQKTLGIDERARNRAGMMSAKRRLAGRSFVVIDDVLTTGATLGEAIRAVRAAGGEVVAAGAVAFTPRFFPPHNERSGTESKQ